MEHIVTNFNLLKFNRDDSALPLYPHPNTHPSWSCNSQQLYSVPPNNYFVVLFEVDDTLSFSPRLINTHFTWSWASYHFKLVPLASIFRPFCSQNLSHSLSFNLIFHTQTLLWKSNIFLVHWSMVIILALSDQHLLWWCMNT